MFGISAVKLVSGVAMIVMLISCGSYLASCHYAPVIDKLHQQIGAEQQSLVQQRAAFDALASQTQAQNAAIEQLRRASEARAAAAAAAIDAAQKTAAAANLRAARIQQATVAPGQSACEAARALIEQTLYGAHQNDP